jgi:hypothetical protein
MGLPCLSHKFGLLGFSVVDQNEIDRNHLIVWYKLYDQGNVIESQGLINYGTTGYAFIDEDYAHHQHQPLYLLKLPRNLTVIDR